VLRSEEAALVAAEAGTAGAASSTDAPEAGEGKKKKKKGGGPPSPAMQALLRSKREREKVLKADQKSAREAFLRARSELELDAIEAVKGNLAEWAA